eukprot:TRINITY_DN75495_c0_g1_i1.p1 TRINITY_DN75495_c0_g1~~TRINITY_DN75495_c0_g1_i1.p1  ORF type:complete len:484 (+),score=52.21 TRINITY_DN75495_c0_g1_i1:37-1452(+)
MITPGGSRDVVQTGASLYSEDTDDAEYSIDKSDGDDDADSELACHPSNVAKAKILGICLLSERGSVYVESRSIYGAVIVMPQLARSMEWPSRLTFEALRSVYFLILDLALQGAFLMYLFESDNVMTGFSGKMFLCDMGALCQSNTANSGPACTGPAGTDITPGRTYDFGTWSTRSFLASSLESIFPGQADAIGSMVDPGEYAMESYWCRWLCVFLFMMTMMQEVTNMYDMGLLLWSVPNRDESWIRFKHHHDSDGAKVADSQGSKKKGTPWYDDVELTVAGMPVHWKILNLVCVLLPKLMIWKLTASTGVTFLMESAGIEDLVVNSVALTFILGISEMVCETVTSETTHEMLSRCKEYPLWDHRKVAQMTDSDIVNTFGSKFAMRPITYLEALQALVPLRFLGVCGLTIFFVWNYYHEHCRLYEGSGTWLPQDLHVAPTTELTFMNALLPSLYPIRKDGDVAWTMPKILSP